MIIYPNGSFITMDGNPMGNFADEEFRNRVLIIDDNSIEGQKILSGAIFNVSLNDGCVNGVYIIERPPEVAGKRVELVKNEFNEWEYNYVDIPLTKEQELEQKINELQATLDALLGVN